MKRIGVIVSKNSEGGLGIPSAYAQYLSNWGNVVPINALDDHFYNDIDLLVLQGGADVDPVRYGNKPGFFTQNPNVQHEWFDINMLPLYLDNNTPIFAVCRGFQTLNVLLGGSLEQNITQEYSGKRSEEVHEISVVHQNAALFEKQFGITKLKSFKVNSLHHQGFWDWQAGAMVKPLYQHTGEKNVEIYFVENKPIIAVQYHPEELYDYFSSLCIRKLINGDFKID